jgi:hypothetical protein
LSARGWVTEIQWPTRGLVGRRTTHPSSRSKRAVGHGATLVLGGRRIDRPGAYVEPTILTDYGEGLFGPAAQVYRVASDAEAVPRGTVLSGGLLGWCLSPLVGVLPVEPHRLACHGD